MGKATDKLRTLRERRDLMVSGNNRIRSMYGGAMDSNYAALFEDKNKTALSALEKEIRTAEAAALSEQGAETAAAMLGDMTKQATRAGKQLAEAFQKGFNGR